MKTYEIRFGAHWITVHVNDGSGHIDSNLSSDPDNADDVEYNHRVDGIESLILAHACAGIDVRSKEYVESIEVAIEAASNNC